MTQAVRSFLAQTEDDDLVLIYFACHGAPDTTAPARPLFLLTHDCDPDDIAGAAMPMEQIAWALDNYVRRRTAWSSWPTRVTAPASRVRGGRTT